MRRANIPLDVDACPDPIPPLRIGYLPCLLCNELVYQCVTLEPCLHKFCGGCLTGWTQDKTTCPYCGEHFLEAFRNVLVDERIREYLKKHPENQRTADDKADLSRRNHYHKPDSNRPHLSFPRQYVAPAPIVPMQPPAARQQLPLYAMLPPDPNDHLYWSGPPRCFQCYRVIDDFRCARAQEHVECYLCKQSMPCRPGAPQQCYICELYFCNVYYRKLRHCELGIHTVDWYIRTAFAQIPSDALYGNPFEQEVLKDALRRMGVALPMIAIRAIETLNMTFNIEKKQNLKINREMYLCGACANELWKEILMFQRVQVNETLPNSIRNRQRCRFGAYCKNQKSNYGHASAFSHII